MSEQLLVGHPPIKVEVRRRKNARRLTLRLAPKGVSLTIPHRTPVLEAERFAYKNEAWLRSKLSKLPQTTVVGVGGQVPIEGKNRLILPGKTRGLRLKPDQLEISGRTDLFPHKIKGFLRELARAKLSQESDKYAAKLGRRYNKLTLRDTRSRWGSCTSTGNLMYSWRLIMAPPEVLSYVAAHEVAHLVEMNHSDAFWALVEDLMPDYANHRKWLRKNGSTLHCIEFDT